MTGGCRLLGAANWTGVVCREFKTTARPTETSPLIITTMTGSSKSCQSSGTLVRPRQTEVFMSSSAFRDLAPWPPTCCSVLTSGRVLPSGPAGLTAPWGGLHMVEWLVVSLCSSRPPLSFTGSREGLRFLGSPPPLLEPGRTFPACARSTCCLVLQDTAPPSSDAREKLVHGAAACFHNPDPLQLSMPSAHSVCTLVLRLPVGVLPRPVDAIKTVNTMQCEHSASEREELDYLSGLEASDWALSQNRN